MSRHEDVARGDHEAFAESLAAYAVDALDDARERDALEAHLETCTVCWDELAALRRATAAVGLGLEPAFPSADLRERVLRQATAQPQSRATSGRFAPATGDAARAPRGSGASLAWLAAAAAIAVAIGASVYAFSLRRELDAVRQLADQAVTRSETLRGELIELRLRASELGRVLNVIGSPDVQQASLTGDGAAAGAIGRAYWSRSKGLVFQALGMPRLNPDRAYQLWIVPRDGAPVSAGLLTVAADGSSTSSTPLADLPVAAAVAVTIEPAGGSASPTMPIVMVGNLN